MVRKMPAHIAFFVDTPAKRAHGISAARLAIGLAETNRVETSLVCYSDDPRPDWLPAAVGINRLGSTRASRSVLRLAHYLRSQQPDVLISRQVHANFVALAAAWIARVPPVRWRGKVIVVHDHPVELAHASNWRDNKWLVRATYRFADALLAPSPTIKDDIIHFCRLQPSEVQVVPPPIPKSTVSLESPPHPWLKSTAIPVFVNTSNMTPWKRLDLLIDAFAEVRKRHDARLLIVGEGPGRQDAIKRIQRLGLSDCVEAVGWVQDPLEFAACAWAFVLASDEEGFAQVLSEAMSVGCPVISTDAQGGGPLFITADGTAGLLVPRGDIAKLAEAMERMLNPEERERYSEFGRRRAAELSPVNSANILINFLVRRFNLATTASPGSEDLPGEANTGYDSGVSTTSVLAERP